MIHDITISFLDEEGRLNKYQFGTHYLTIGDELEYTKVSLKENEIVELKVNLCKCFKDVFSKEI